MYRGLSHKGTTCYRHSNFFMVTKDKAGTQGREKWKRQKKCFALPSHLEREVPDREKFAENLNALVKQAHTLSLLPSSFPFSLGAQTSMRSIASLFLSSPPFPSFLDTWTKQSQLRAF